MIRVVLPAHLRALAQVTGEVRLDVAEPVTQRSVLDALEALSVANVGTRADFYWTLHAVFVKRHEHTILFDQAFRIFFRKRGYIEKMIASVLPEITPGNPKAPPPGAQRIQEALFSGITTVHDWCHNIITSQHAEEDIRALQETGIRGRFCYGPARRMPFTEAPTAFSYSGTGRSTQVVSLTS